MDEKYLYQEQWKEYKGRRYIKFFFWIVYCGLLTMLYFSNVTSAMKGGLALILITGFFLIEFYVANFECPRCGNKFFKKKRKLFALASWGQCVHCDLKLYEGSKYKWSLIG